MSSLAGERLRRNALFTAAAACAVCGVRDSIVLNSDARMILCGDCEAIARGLAPVEDHHVAGRSYHSLTLPVSINTHRRLTARQRAWLKRIKRLPVATARKVALLRGFGDLLHESADTIEERHAMSLSEKETA